MALRLCRPDPALGACLAGLCLCLVCPALAHAQWALERDVRCAGGGAAAAGPYAIMDTVGQPAVGAAASAHYALEYGFWPELILEVAIANVPPLARADSAERPANTSLKILAEKLVANDTDADGDELTLSAVSPTSANGAAVELDGRWVVYVPLTGFNATDTFTYTVSDPHGATATGMVTMLVRPDSDAPSRNILRIEMLPDTGCRRVTFVGIPGRTYRIQATDSLSPAAWTTLDTATPAANGLYQFTDLDTASHPVRFYRSLSP